MAHDQPKYLAKLVEYLRCDWACIFIHIDCKVNIAEFRKWIPDQNRITFLNNNHRVRVNRSGFSHITATLNLLEASLNCDEHFDRFCLLSGSDFPIKNIEEIKASFHSPKEFMRIGYRIDEPNNSIFCRNVKFMYFMDSPFPRITRKLIKIPRKVYNKIHLYKGSAFWSLTEGCISYITGFLHDNKDYAAFHKHTLTPEEIFFHSIVKSSPFGANITHDFEKANNLNDYSSLNEHGCHYIDWNAKGVRLPKVLNESDINNLLNSKALFARKFREGESDRLLQMIEKKISNKG